MARPRRVGGLWLLAALVALQAAAQPQWLQRVCARATPDLGASQQQPRRSLKFSDPYPEGTEAVPGRFLVRLRSAASKAQAPDRGVATPPRPPRPASSVSSRAQQIVRRLARSDRRTRLLREYKSVWEGFCLQTEDVASTLAGLDAEYQVLSVNPVVSIVAASAVRPPGGQHARWCQPCGAWPGTGAVCCVPAAPRGAHAFAAPRDGDARRQKASPQLPHDDHACPL